jgi:hypothetical protein
MSEVYKVTGAIPITFPLSTPFLRFDLTLQSRRTRITWRIIQVYDFYRKREKHRCGFIGRLERKKKKE